MGQFEDRQRDSADSYSNSESQQSTEGLTKPMKQTILKVKVQIKKQNRYFTTVYLLNKDTSCKFTRRQLTTVH